MLGTKAKFRSNIHMSAFSCHPRGCPNARPHRDKIASKLGRQLSSDELLSTPEGIKKFSEWAPATGLFKRRYGVGSGV